MGQFKAGKPRTGFTRPSITLGNGGAKQWKTAKVKDLAVGDIIASKGIVKSIDLAYRDDYRLIVGDDVVEFLTANTEVFAFTKGE